MTINKIDLNKLQTYSGKTTQSFEQLIYTLMKNEYGRLGKFTPIAGAGGDSGIEFYLDLPNGERWGWQCKWYPDNGRLSQANRYASIENSLETACANNSNLTKWFLCLRSNLTISISTKKGAPKKGEREWFEQRLPKKIPAGKSISIEFLGETEIVHMIGEIKNIGARNFFFGELEFSQEWFFRKFSENFEQVKSKYEPELHTMDDFVQSIIDFKLINSEYNLVLDTCIQKLNTIEIEIHHELKEYHNISTYNQEDKEAKEKGAVLLSDFEKHKLLSYQILNDIQQYINNYNIAALTSLDFTVPYSAFHEYLSKLDRFTISGNELISRQVSSIYYVIKNFFEEAERFIRNYTHSIDNEIHFIANPAEGKTHTSVDIAYKRIQNSKPAIFLTGNKFNHETDLEQTILKRLDIPSVYSFEDMLSSLDIYGSLAKVRIPLIIDGLNETVNNKLFSDIWRNYLPSLISKIKRFENLVLITTCRKSYKNEVWGAYDSKSFIFLGGFDGYEVTREAIEKYFKRYRIKANLNFSNLNTFSKPIFLKLYCEIKNPQWQEGNEIEVTLDDDSSNILFESYFKQINTSVALTSHLIRKNENFIQTSLSMIAKYLWENNAREIGIDKYYELIDGTAEYNAETSRADILINEGLIITRDYRTDHESISITYELMSGYLIAKYLIDNLTDQDFMPKQAFHKKIGTENDRHPLYENIIEELALIFPKFKAKKLHNIYKSTDDNYIHSVSVNSLWKLHYQYISKEDIELVRGHFRDTPKNRKRIINLCMDTITNTSHPLNINFLSSELLALKVWERDLSWTEYIRESAYTLMPLIEEFEQWCKEEYPDSEIGLAKIHLTAEYFKWFLTSTNRQLRDYATRALYYYGRRFPNKFAEMTLHSLECNDPYLWERMLAALYGICLAEHHSTDFQKKHLANIATILYESIFAKNADHYSTHILARDYARGCIRVTLIHQPNHLTKQQIKRVAPPYPLPQNEPPMIEDSQNLTYRKPLDMDFSNYTIGYIVKDGHSYDNPPEKQKVRRQILHRVEELGWSEERFKSVDDRISRNHLDRSERPPIERYGKKYSRIAFYEIAGYRDDQGLLPNEIQHFRLSGIDLDPSFPEEVKTDKLIETDLLGDRSLPLNDWLKTDEFPNIEQYLKPMLADNIQFICMDGYIMQRDEQAHRERFTFIRSFIVDNEDYSKLLPLIRKQSLGGRWLPEKHENTDAYAGEYYLFEEATYSNRTTLEFILSSEDKIVKRGEEGYYPDFRMKKSKDGSIFFGSSYPKTRKVTTHEKAKFEVLMPVMSYHGPSDNKEINKASSTTILAKEIVMDLGLIEKAQTFDLFDNGGALACQNIAYHENSNNIHRMVYLRKDLLDKYLSKNNLKFFWAIWGEREPSPHYRSAEHNSGNKISDYFVFQKIQEYER